MLRNPNPAESYPRYITVYYKHPDKEAIAAGVVMDETSTGYLLANVGNEGFSNMPLSCLFGTRESAEQALRTAQDARQAEYEHTIPDIESLVKFVYGECATTWEIENPPAARAFKAKASELLGITL